MEERNGEGTAEHPIIGKSALSKMTSENMAEASPTATQNDEEPGGTVKQSSAPPVDGIDEASRLRALATNIRDQDDLERDVGRQVWLFAVEPHHAQLIKINLVFRPINYLSNKRMSATRSG